MRILHILDHSLPLHSGYTFRTRSILTAQAGKGLAVAGVTGLRHEAASSVGWSTQTETVDGLTFFRTPAPKRAITLPIVSELAEVFALARRTNQLVTEWQPDVLHAHSPLFDGLAAWIVARRRGLPFVYEIRAFWEDAAVGNGTGREGSLRFRMTKWIETRIAHAADAVTVICEGLRGDLVARGVDPAKIAVAANAVDLKMFGEPRPRDDMLAAQLKLPRDADVIGFIGSFYDYEGLDDLIAAMPALVAARPSAHLLLVGGGPMEAALRAQAEASPAAHRIHFIGRVPHAEVERYYSLIDVLAYPRKAMRLTELVTPLKPLEAMAQRKLVAASSVGGHRELIEDGVTGTLFPPDDPDALAASLTALFQERHTWPERLARARAFVERERNWSLTIETYRPVYQRLARKRAASAKLGGMSAVTGTTMIPRELLVKASEAPIEAPLGVAVGGSLAFALFAMPDPLFTGIFVAAPDLAVRAVIAAVCAAGAGAGTWKLLMLAGQQGLPKRRSANGVPTIRRADAHPDAPARRPIFASSDLGTALMDVEVNPAAPQQRTARKSIRAVEEEPLELTERVPEDYDAQPNPTISALMGRLKTGLERRAATGETGAPAPHEAMIRGAVEELSRLTARRR